MRNSTHDVDSEDFTTDKTETDFATFIPGTTPNLKKNSL
jgi:hypothetical protein